MQPARQLKIVSKEVRRKLSLAAKGKRKRSADILSKIVAESRRKGATSFVRKFRPKLFKGKYNYLVDLSPTLGESNFGVSIFVIKGGEAHALFTAKLVFPSPSVLNITAVQGTYNTHTDALKDLKEHAKVPAEQFLVSQVEKYAKSAGCKKVRLVFPESLESFKHPVVDNEISQTQKGRTFLQLFNRDALSKEQQHEFNLMYDAATKKARKKIKELYESVALGCGYASGKKVDVPVWPSSQIIHTFWEKEL